MRRRHPAKDRLQAAPAPGSARPAPPQQGRYAQKAASRRAPWRMAALMLGVSVVLGSSPGNIAAQSSDQVQISVAPRIVAKAASEFVLAIEIGPPHVVPPKSFVSLRGLPAQVSLTSGHLVAPGLWAVSLSALPTLKAWIPDGISGDAEIGVRLIGMDGRLIAQTTTALIIGSDPAQSGAPTKPARSAPAVVARQPPPSNIEPGKNGDGPAPRPPQLPSAEKTRAENLLARGLDYLTAGNVAAARDFFERAAEIGLAAAALRLAATYDPAELPLLRAHGVVADSALARKWYQRARDLGSPEAASRLARLGGGN